MKRLSPKGGRKIHPSPVEDPIRAAFRLLPAAILFLVAGLGPEDRELLAYFVTVPVEGVLSPEEAAAAAAVPPARGRGGYGRRVGCAVATPPALAPHSPTHGCACFECYISFWARLNCSPESNRIQDVLEAYEYHRLALPSPSKRRDRGKRSKDHAAPPPLPMPLRRPESPPPQVVKAVQAPASPLSPPPLPLPPAQAPAAPTAEEEEEEQKFVPELAPAAEPEECREAAMESGEEERKRGWAGVVGGVLGLRLWSIWSPAVESAT
ncbi:hypothetical protein QOZ80_2BG0187180 [Eleusine coracana subsp. coracana]|nr:hypothetical protein QOZ80_2BG0187180 [Eleusine coracana subsp. coracana]